MREQHAGGSHPARRHAVLKCAQRSKRGGIVPRAGENVFRLMLGAALLCAFALGELAAAQTLPVTPGEVDGYLVQRERREPGIRPGTERTMRWANGRPERTPLAFVYLHGYSATRQEVAPLADRVASAFGANLFYTRLSGHGRDGDAMLGATAAALREDALEALAIGGVIGERVVLLSTSTGSTLSTWLASRAHDDAIAALVMISPNFAPRDRMLYAFDWPLVGPLLTFSLRDAYRTWQPYNREQALYWTWRYPYAALAELARLMNEVEKIDKSAIRTPTLMIYSPRDQVVDPEAIVQVFAHWGGTHKRLLAFEGATDPAQHVLAGDVLSPGSTGEMTRLIDAYLREVLRQESTAGAIAD